MTGESNYKRTGPTCVIGTQSSLLEPNILKCLLFSAPVKRRAAVSARCFSTERCIAISPLSVFLDSGKQNASTCQISEVNGAFSISPLVGSPSSLGIRHFVSPVRLGKCLGVYSAVPRGTKGKLLLLPEILFEINNQQASQFELLLK